MKKIALALLALTLLLGLCACGGDQKPAEETQQTTTTQANDFNWEDDSVFNDAELSWD